MAHPLRQQVLDTYKEKHSRLVKGEAKAEHPWRRAERISQATPATMPKPPVEAVPQFIEDRAVKDVPYGSEPAKSVDD